MLTNFTRRIMLSNYQFPSYKIGKFYVFFAKYEQKWHSDQCFSLKKNSDHCVTSEWLSEWHSDQCVSFKSFLDVASAVLKLMKAPGTGHCANSVRKKSALNTSSEVVLECDKNESGKSESHCTVKIIHSPISDRSVHKNNTSELWSFYFLTDYRSLDHIIYPVKKKCRYMNPKFYDGKSHF